MFKFIFILISSIFIFSCAETTKNKNTSNSLKDLENTKTVSISPDKKIFIKECNNYLIKNEKVNSYLLNYLCNQKCGYSCLALYNLGKNKEYLLKAIKYMNNECKDNIDSSCLLLGKFYLLSGDKEKASFYLSKSCNLGNKEACYKLALLNKDTDLYEKYLLTSCNLNFGKACFQLGAYFYKKNEINKAIEYLNKSCNKNFLKACFLLSKIYLKDKKDIKNAIKYLDKSCKLNSNNACLYIGYMYYQGKNIEKDKDRALNYFKYACDKLNSSKGCSLTGIILYGRNDYINSISYLNKGCFLKDGSGCLSLSLLLIKGEVFNKNPILAMKYLKLAKKYGVDKDILKYLCKAGLKDACKEEKTKN